MQLVILAAGKGTRMYPLTKTVPKPMIPLLGKPKLEYTLETLPEEIDEIIFVVNYLADQIKSHFGDEFGGRKIKYVLQEELNGTGGAIHACKDMLRENFLVMMGDDLYDPEDIKKMLRENLAILVFETNQIGRFGKILEDRRGNFAGIIENRNGETESRDQGVSLLNTGMYLLNRNFFEYELVSISDLEFGLPQTLAKMANKEKVRVVRTKKWTPLGKTEDLEIAEQALKDFFMLQ